jgi:YVTN family beta-propeller protein
VATSPDGCCAYVADPGPGNLAVIDTHLGRVVSTISIGPYLTDPFSAAATRHAIYVTDQGANMLSVVDPRTLHVVATVTTGSGPYGVAVALH